jgi:hypothetical protein
MSEPTDGRRSLKRAWVWLAQLVLAVLVGWFVWQSVSGNLGEFTALETPLAFRFSWVALAALLVWTSYALLILAWRTVLGGWGQRLPVRSAARIWCLSNLGRYLPGKVWSVAGLAVLAQRAGIHGWAAAASALAMQALAVGTGAGVAIAFLPQAESPVLLVIAIAVAVASVVALTLKPLVRVLARVANGKIQLQPLPATAVLAGAAATLVAWVLYGLAFRFLALGLLAQGAPSLPLSIGSFAGSYIVGLFAVFAPGGIGIREGMLLGYLTPSIGGGAALAISVGSRLLLTFTEVTAALVAASLGKEKGERA